MCWPKCTSMLIQTSYLWNSDEESDDINGHITSLSVLRTHRKLGIANKLMQAARKIIALSLCYKDV